MQEPSQTTLIIQYFVADGAITDEKSGQRCMWGAHSLFWAVFPLFRSIIFAYPLRRLRPSNHLSGCSFSVSVFDLLSMRIAAAHLNGFSGLDRLLSLNPPEVTITTAITTQPTSIVRVLCCCHAMWMINKPKKSRKKICRKSHDKQWNVINNFLSIGARDGSTDFPCAISDCTECRWDWPLEFYININDVSVLGTWIMTFPYRCGRSGVGRTANIGVLCDQKSIATHTEHHAQPRHGQLMQIFSTSPHPLAYSRITHTQTHTES